MSDLVEKVDAERDVEDAGDENDNGPAPEEESTATFVPVMTLVNVETKSHEEDEDVVFKQRGKLFTFGETLLDKGTGVKSWKERGVGDVRFLKHKESNRIRVLMRQEKTMKVIVNHFLDPRIVLTPNAGNDKSWVWVAFDFSDGELVETTFAIRFGSAEIAQEYKAEFAKAQAEMQSLLFGADSSEGSAEADSAAAAIESLSVKPAEEETAKEEVSKPSEEPATA